MPEQVLQCLKSIQFWESRSNLIIDPKALLEEVGHLSEPTSKELWMTHSRNIIQMTQFEQTSLHPSTAITEQAAMTIQEGWQTPKQSSYRGKWRKLSSSQRRQGKEPEKSRQALAFRGHNREIGLHFQKIQLNPSIQTQLEAEMNLEALFNMAYPIFREEDQDPEIMIRWSWIIQILKFKAEASAQVLEMEAQHWDNPWISSKKPLLEACHHIWREAEYLQTRITDQDQGTASWTDNWTILHICHTKIGKYSSSWTRTQLIPSIVIPSICISMILDTSQDEELKIIAWIWAEGKRIMLGSSNIKEGQ